MEELCILKSTSLQSIRASEHQSIRASEHQNSTISYIRQKLDYILLLMLFILSNINVLSTQENRCEPCCWCVDISFTLIENCCVSITVHNENCNSDFKFQYFNPSNNTWEVKHIEGGYQVTYTMCPEYGEVDFKFRVSIVDPGNHNLLWCNPNYEEIEGWNVYTFETDASQCCQCPDNRNAWLNTYIGPHPDCEDGCKIQHSLNIPRDITCFKYYYYENPGLEIQIGNYPSSLTNEPLSNYDRCLSLGQTSDTNVYLMRYPDDPEPCLLRAVESCDSLPPDNPLPKPCDQSCADSVWKNYSPIDLYPIGCPSCKARIHYKARKKCDGKQQLEILRIEYLNPPNCLGCSLWSIMRQSLLKIISTNAMKFEPLGENQCDTTWQVGNGSCWASYYEYYLYMPEFDPSNPILTPIIDSVLVVQKCDSVECCIRNYVVCKYGTNIRVTSDISNNNPVLCDYRTIKDPWGNYHSCLPNCEWMDFDTLWTEYNESVEIREQLDEDRIKINKYHLKQNILEIPNPYYNHALNLIIYDLIGNRVKQISIDKQSRLYEVDIDAFQNGTYIFIISNEKEILHSGKFTKIK